MSECRTTECQTTQCRMPTQCQMPNAKKIELTTPNLTNSAFGIGSFGIQLFVPNSAFRCSSLGRSAFSRSVFRHRTIKKCFNK
jgi:hypothetical protein